MSGGLPVILGAGGFIGKRLALALLGRGHTVRLFDRSYSRDFLSRLEGFRNRFELVEGNLESPADREKAIRGSETVFYLVSSSVPATSPLRLDVEVGVNLPNALTVIHTMLKHRIERIIFPSSGGAIYGECATGRMTESAPLNPAGAYGMGKLLVEETLRYYRRAAGLKDLIVRVSNVYGASERATFRQGAIDAFIMRHWEGMPVPLWGDGAAVRDYIHIDDVVTAIVRLYEQETCGIEVNVGSGVGFSLRDVISLIQDVSGVPVKIERMEGMYTGLKRSVLDVSRLKTITGYSATTSLKEGISRCWDAITTPGRMAEEQVPVGIIPDPTPWPASSLLGPF
jgi:UDP-glucose 4-epimerase